VIADVELRLRELVEAHGACGDVGRGQLQARDRVVLLARDSVSSVSMLIARDCV